MSARERSFELHDLFPPSASTSQPRERLESRTLALIGNLPSSSLLHFALNHLSHQVEDASESLLVPRLSDKARGKQRANEPDTRHVERSDSPSEQDEILAPARAETSNTVDPRKGPTRRAVLVLTPNLAAFRRTLVAENDFTLFGCDRDADRTVLLRQITIKTLPTSAHLSYFLASRYDHKNPSAPELYSTYTSTFPPQTEDPSYLPFEPTLVVLHSPSTYLEESVHADSGIEAYASMLALFVSTFTCSSRSPPQLVLFDPRASSVSLPIIPLHLAAGSRKRPRGDDAEVVERMPLDAAIERFFHCVARVFPVPLSPTDLEFGHVERWRIEARTRTDPNYSFLDFTTQRVGEDDQDDEEPGATRILIEG